MGRSSHVREPVPLVQWCWGRRRRRLRRERGVRGEVIPSTPAGPSNRDEDRHNKQRVGGFRAESWKCSTTLPRIRIIIGCYIDKNVSHLVSIQIIT